MKKNIPINKGNYSLDTDARNAEFDRRRGFGCVDEYRKNRSEWEKFPAKMYVAPYPLLVDLELSTLCNLKCPFCYTITQEFKDKVKATLMDYSLFTRIVDEISGHVYALRLSLRGEPTLHPRLKDCIQYAKSKGIYEVSMLTNASKMTPDYFKEIMDAGIDWITVSFDGLYENYEKNRYPLKFEEIYNNLKKSIQMRDKSGCVKPVIKIQTIWPAIEKNPSSYYKIMAEVSDLVAFNPLIDCINTKNYEEIEFEEDFICPQLYQRLVISADGRALLCANDEHSEHIVGDAYRQSIYDIWHGQQLKDVREIHRKKDGFLKISICRKCYLPRKTHEDVFEVDGRPLIVRNYA